MQTNVGYLTFPDTTATLRTYFFDLPKAFRKCIHDLSTLFGSKHFIKQSYLYVNILRFSLLNAHQISAQLDTTCLTVWWRRCKKCLTLDPHEDSNLLSLKDAYNDFLII